MAAIKFIAKRLTEFAASLLALSFVVFSLLYLAPGDPARVLIGVKRANPELIAAIRAEYHLDDPFFSQYFSWLGKALHFDFGSSIRTGAPVTQMVAPYVGVTMELVLISLVLSIIIGITCGVLSAKRRNKASDKAINLLALVGTSAPSFAVGLLFLYFFALTLGWFPVYGVGSDGLLDNLRHMALPAITLTFAVSALLIKITRSAMLAEIDLDYGTFLRARAVPAYKATLAQLRNAAGPILTSVGLLLANLFGSTVLIETTFAIPGVGNLLAASVTFKDVPVVQFLTMMLAFFICLASALVDIGVYFANPQSRIKRNVSLER
jgi:peptide/nickel transport system permease protein